MSAEILHGDCLDILRGMPDASVDAIVTDPPYGLRFMGKAWDHGVPGAPFWAAPLRVAKPGAYLLACGGTRTFHRLTCAIEDAGWEVHDCLAWLYGSGFPKHASKLKPAWEPIILARKPAPKATPLQVDACRIEGPSWQKRDGASGAGFSSGKFMGAAGIGEPTQPFGERASPGGRWPANVVLDEESASLLDALTGERTSGKMRAGTKRQNRAGWAGDMPTETGAETYGDSGGASRFFYCAKASRAERNAGDVANVHPTVKPLALMRWLCRLVAPPGGLILDPFAGSGTTGVAAVLEGYRFVGIERDATYVEIARRRLAACAPQGELLMSPPVPAA